VAAASEFLEGSGGQRGIDEVWARVFFFSGGRAKGQLTNQKGKREIDPNGTLFFAPRFPSCGLGLGEQSLPEQILESSVFINVWILFRPMPEKEG